MADRIMAVRTLRLYIDRLASKAARAAPLAAATRVRYAREGDATIRAAGQTATLAANGAWHGTVACEVCAGNHGAALLRWVLVPIDARAGEAGERAEAWRALDLVGQGPKACQYGAAVLRGVRA